MITFNKPANLNGEVLFTELKNAEIDINVPPSVDGNGNLVLEINVADKQKAAAVIAKHNWIDTSQIDLENKKILKVQAKDKLQALGLSVDEIEALIG